MISLEFLLVAGIFVGGLFYLIFCYPIVGVCLAVWWIGSQLVCVIMDRREAAKLKRVTFEVGEKYPDFSDFHRERITRAVMEGANIDDFSVEDGWLKRGQGEGSTYARPAGEWGSKNYYLDIHPLYAKEKAFLQAHYSSFDLSDAESHELCALMYFNWEIFEMDTTQEDLIVRMSRRGETALKRYRRAAASRKGDSPE